MGIAGVLCRNVASALLQLRLEQVKLLLGVCRHKSEALRIVASERWPVGLVAGDCVDRDHLPVQVGYHDQVVGPIEPNGQPTSVRLNIPGNEFCAALVNMQFSNNIARWRDDVNQRRGSATKEVRISIRTRRDISESHESVAYV